MESRIALNAFRLASNHAGWTMETTIGDSRGSLACFETKSMSLDAARLVSCECSACDATVWPMAYRNFMNRHCRECVCSSCICDKRRAACATTMAIAQIRQGHEFCTCFACATFRDSSKLDEYNQVRTKVMELVAGVAALTTTPPVAPVVAESAVEAAAPVPVPGAAAARAFLVSES